MERVLTGRVSIRNSLVRARSTSVTKINIPQGF